MEKNWPIVALAVALIAIVCVSSYTNPSDYTEQAGTNSGAPTANVAHQEQAQSGEATHHANYAPFWRRLFAWPEGVAALAILLTLFFIALQAMLMRQTVMSSDDASKRELRAYLSAAVGEAVYQERRPAAQEGDLMFECRPLLINTGRTPARKIRFKARAAILPDPLPIETHLPEGADEGQAYSILGALQNGHMFAVVDGFRPDDEVDDIKQGTGGKGLYVWALVTYEDVFGDPHFLRFCQHTYWDGKGGVRCFYVPGRNDAD